MKDAQGCTVCSNDYASGILGTISASLNMHIPKLNYETLLGTTKIWMDFEFLGENNGDLLWKLSDFGQK